MRIGIDIDDTITETHEYVIKKICEIYSLKKEEICNTNYNELNLNYPKFFTKDNFNSLVEKVKLKNNVKNILKKINLNNEIYFITSRNNNEYNYPYNQTVKYLIKNNIPFDNLAVNIMDKGEYCLQNDIDLFIDDSIKHCDNVSNKGIETIIFDATYNKEANYPRVYNWEDVYKYLERR